MHHKTFITLFELSRRLGLSEGWLKAEAKAKRLPSLLVGRQLMFNADDVEHILLERTRANIGNEQEPTNQICGSP